MMSESNTAEAGEEEQLGTAAAADANWDELAAEGAATSNIPSRNGVEDRATATKDTTASIMAVDAVPPSAAEEQEVPQETTPAVPPPPTAASAKPTGPDPAKDTAESLIETTSAEATSAAAAAAAASSSERPWDKSNLKVVIHGVMKFHDTKAVSKMVDRWLKDIVVQSSSSEGGAALKLEYDKVKKPPNSTWMMVIMKEESMVKPLVDYINNNSEVCNKRGEKLYAKPGVDSERRNPGAGGQHNNSSSRKRKSENGDKNLDDDPRVASSKRLRNVPTTEKLQMARRAITVAELRDRITPLWTLAPEQQLHKKMMEMVKKCAQKITKEIKAKFSLLNKSKGRERVKVYRWIEGRRNIELDKIVSAPTPLRNKCEFTINYRYLLDETETTATSDRDDAMVESEEAAAAAPQPSGETRKVPACGFLVTGWAGGVSFSDSLRNMPSEVCVLVDIFNKFIATSSLEPYDPLTHTGFWRLLTVRISTRTRECMVIIQHVPTSGGGAGEPDDSKEVQSPDFTEAFSVEKERLIPILTEANLAREGEEPLKITSVFFQEFGGLSSPPPEHPVQHAYGKTFLTEKLGKCLFSISPGAFFQVNTEGAETLYQLAVDKIREVSADPAKTLLFDVCCGTGTIGLTMMKEGVVGSVVGVDMSEPAIEDAKRNAVLNGFGGDDGGDNKTRFVAARAEHVLAHEIKKAKSLHGDMKFVAVVDPARDGLHPDVVKTIRTNEQISRLVYVSCNPTGTLPRDASLLCSPPTKKYSGRPFKITAASPVDMFPLTTHCEMVMTFDRLTFAEMNGE